MKMNNRKPISLTICWVLAVISGLPLVSLAGNESGMNAKAEQHFEKANELLNQKQYEPAINELKEVINISPSSRIAQDAQYWMGQSYFLAGQYDDAEATFASLMETYPGTAIIPATKLMAERVEQSKEKKALVEAIEKGDLEQLKSLISKGADANTNVDAAVSWHVDGEPEDFELRQGLTLLNLAIIHRQADIATFLINQGADVNGRDGFDNHKTPLHYVAHFGTAALAKLLIAKGADVNARESQGRGDWTPLHCVTSNHNPDRKDQLEVAKLLISNGADIEAVDGDGNRPLHGAARCGRLDVAELLMSKGANVEARGWKKQTPLHKAAVGEGWSKTAETSGKRLEIAKLLLDNGAYIDSRDRIDATPLGYAVAKGSEDMVELLLARGAAPWRRRGGGDYVGTAMQVKQKKMVKFLVDKGFEHSAIHVAAFFGDLGAVRSYLAAGGDINAQGPSWLTLLACALMGGHTELAKFLINEGADINLKGAEGKTALHWAVTAGGAAGYPEIARMLLDKGADVTIGDHCGRTALLLAAAKDQKDIVEMILAKGADVNAKSDFSLDVGIEDETALHEACLLGRAAAAEVLIAHGADVNAKNKNGKTPMDYAKSQGHEEVIELLRKHGAKE
jgi:ankyrin repeat protein